jgi:hypothetical protein
MLKFESLDACWREDIRRALALRRLPKSFYASIGECDPLQLASVLAEAAEARCIAKCAASAAYMRDRRLALLGSLLKLIDDEAQTDLTFVSISHVGWYFTARYNWRMPKETLNKAGFLFQLPVEACCCLSNSRGPHCRSVGFSFGQRQKDWLTVTPQRPPEGPSWR